MKTELSKQNQKSPGKNNKPAKQIIMASHVETTAQAGSDIVIPLHYFDDSPMFSRITMYALMVYDEVLDPKLLHSTLEKVVRRDTWQKLGGRVRKGVCRVPLNLFFFFFSSFSFLTYRTHPNGVNIGDQNLTCMIIYLSRPKD